MRDKRYQASGLTTIELLIALAVFGAVLVSLIGLHLVALSTGTLAETASIAMNWGFGYFDVSVRSNPAAPGVIGYDLSPSGFNPQALAEKFGWALDFATEVSKKLQEQWERSPFSLHELPGGAPVFP